MKYQELAVDLLVASQNGIQEQGIEKIQPRPSLDYVALSVLAVLRLMQAGLHW
jgi:hypothetical protein